MQNQNFIKKGLCEVFERSHLIVVYFFPELGNVEKVMTKFTLEDFRLSIKDSLSFDLT